jgi:hypothetical protein
MAQSEGFDQNAPHPHARGGTNDSAAENAIKILAAKEKKIREKYWGEGQRRGFYYLRSSLGGEEASSALIRH